MSAPGLRILAVIAALVAAWPVAAGAVEVNTASQAELESVRGVGVAMSEAILAERAKRPFDDWADLGRRVKGTGGSAARRHSAAGLTVHATPYRSVSVSPAASAR